MEILIGVVKHIAYIAGAVVLFTAYLGLNWLYCYWRNKK